MINVWNRLNVATRQVVEIRGADHGYPPAMRVVVLGAGFGGLELTTRLSEEFGDDVDVVLIDQSDGFVFGFSKLDVMFGRAPAERGAPLRTPTS